MKIRRASIEDAEPIACIGSAVWATTYATNGVSPAIARYIHAEFTPQQIASKLGSLGHPFWVLDAEDGPVGFAEVAINNDEAEVERIYILEQFCRMGHGSTLLRTLSQELFQDGIQRIWLSVWSKNNRAMEFYRSAGWKHVSDTEFLLDGIPHLNHVFETNQP